MKKILLLVILLILLMNNSNAQININLIINGTPPARLIEWQSKQGTATMVVTNLTQQNRQVKVRSEFKNVEGTIIGLNDPTKTRIITIAPGNTILQANDILPLEAMNFSGIYASSLSKTGKLPQGSYQLCVRLDSSNLPVPITQTQCRFFTLTGVQLPILIMPTNEQKVDPLIAQNTILFRWTNVIKSGTELANYQLQAFEILPFQQSIQALRSNQPLLNVTVKGTTQYIWRPQLLFNDSLPHKFIWTIRTTDSQGNSYSTTDGNEEGRSEPKIFTIERVHYKKKIIETPKDSIN